ncbi:MAG: carboxylating nicotinate-nucleotide diphosphorylase [Chitinophagia bacterium]|nr:carboxylating nicotinate-nucleotide diphosphorylase [Chitinophagia bacterium]
MFNQKFVIEALMEDVGEADHTTLACIKPDAPGKALLKVKENCILAGVFWAKAIVHYLQPDAQFTIFLQDGTKAQAGSIAFEIEATASNILKAERLLLNCMQRMSGIATLTHQYVNMVAGYNVKILDTRKTTPLFRTLEKEAVRIGGGTNHRMGLYDMIMIKDNHIDYCGGIETAINRVYDYIASNGLKLKVEVETRNLEDVKQVLAIGGVHRIMLDNFTPEQLKEAVMLIDGKVETEASGGINMDNIVSYAATGVDSCYGGCLAIPSRIKARYICL